MSAINHLKKFALTVTGNLFASSKGHQQQKNVLPGKEETGTRQNVAVRYKSAGQTKQVQTNQALSEFTIF